VRRSDDRHPTLTPVPFFAAAIALIIVLVILGIMDSGHGPS
jgi:hypothetical protein